MSGSSQPGSKLLIKMSKGQVGPHNYLLLILKILYFQRVSLCPRKLPSVWFQIFSFPQFKHWSCFTTPFVGKKGKVKFSHTRYQALDSELIPVYKQSACKWFSAGHFSSSRTYLPSTSTKLYCLMTETHTCEELAQGCYAALSRLKLNRRHWSQDQRLTATPLCYPLEQT